MNEDFRKVVRIGTVPRGWGKRPDTAVNVFCKIEMKDGRLSISGVEGPRATGNCEGSCGQIDMHLRDRQATITPAPGWTRDKLARFFEVWKRWHLNDMKAGSPAQEAYLREHPLAPDAYAHPKNHYEVACAHLAAAGLNPDSSGYEYGSAWKREEVPAEVIEFLQSLPDADKTPAWV